MSPPQDLTAHRDDPWAGHPAWPKVQRVITLLHLGSVLYWLITILAYSTVFTDFGFSLTAILPSPLAYLVLGYLTVACVGLTIMDVIVVRGLRQRRPWAWVTALILFAFDASSLFFLPLTFFGFKALGDAEVRAAFD